MAGWREEGESAAITRQRKREAEEADEVIVVSGVTVRQLRRFRAALLEPSLASLKRRRLLQSETPKTPFGMKMSVVLTCSVVFPWVRMPIGSIDSFRLQFVG